MSTAETFTDLRLRQGLSQAQVPGFTQTAISRLERGVNRPQPRTIRRLAEVMGLPMERVASACMESWRRAHPAIDVAIVPHGSGSTEGGAA